MSSHQPSAAESINLADGGPKTQAPRKWMIPGVVQRLPGAPFPDMLLFLVPEEKVRLILRTSEPARFLQVVGLVTINPEVRFCLSGGDGCSQVILSAESVLLSRPGDQAQADEAGGTSVIQVPGDLWDLERSAPTHLENCGVPERYSYQPSALRDDPLLHAVRLLVRPNSRDFQWIVRKRPPIFGHERATQVLRLGLYLQSILTRLACEAQSSFEQFLTEEGFDGMRSEEFDALGARFWKNQLRQRFETTRDAFIVCERDHPATPTHLTQVRVSVSTSTPYAYAEQPHSNEGTGTIVLNPKNLDPLCAWNRLGELGRLRLTAKIRNTTVHEAMHLFRAGSTRPYTHPKDGSFDAYVCSPEEIIANAAGSAVFVATYSTIHPTGSPLDFLEPYGPWGRYFTLYRTSEYVRRHPCARSVARKFDWLFARYLQMFRGSLSQECARTQLLASRAW